MVHFYDFNHIFKIEVLLLLPS